MPVSSTKRVSMLRALTTLAAVASQPRAWKSGATIAPIIRILTRCHASQRPPSLERGLDHLAVHGLLIRPSPLNRMTIRLTRSGRLLAGLLRAASSNLNRWYPHPRFLMRIQPAQRRVIRMSYRELIENGGEAAHKLNRPLDS